MRGRSQVIMRWCGLGTAAVLVASMFSFVSSPTVAVADPLPPTEVLLTTDKLTFDAGDTFTLTATVDQPLEDTSATLTITDVTNTSDVKQCTSGVECEIELSFASGGPRDYIATVDTLESDTVTVARSAWVVTLDSDEEELAAGETATLTATVNQDLADTSGEYSVAIFDTTSELRVETCTTGTECLAEVTAYDNPVATTDYVAVVLAASDTSSDTLFEATDVQASSDPVSVDRQAWVVDLTSDDETLEPGQETYLRATVDQDLADTNGLYSIYIFEVSKDIFIAQCDLGDECSGVAGWTTTDPWDGFFQAVVAERLPEPPTSFYDLQDQIGWGSTQVWIAESEWEADLSIDATDLGAGETATLTATVNFDVADTEGRYAIYIVLLGRNRILKSCESGTTCVAEFSFYDEYDQLGPTDELPSVIVGAPGAETQSEITNWKIWTGTQGDWIERRPWASQLLYTGGTTLTLSTNQDVGVLNGDWAWFLFHFSESAAPARVDECYSGPRCILTAGSLGDGGYVAFLARNNNPSGMGDISVMMEAASLDQPYSDRFGPSLTSPITGRGETTGGGNPAQGDCSACHADPVNTATGEFFLPEKDLELTGAGPTLSVARNYSTTGAAAPGPFGYGWAPSFGGELRTLVPTDDANPLPRQVEIEQENGSILLFTRDGSSSDFVAPDRMLATLEWDDSGDEWILVRRQDEVIRFDEDGYLVSVEDLDGNALTFTYDAGKVDTISASGGREVSVLWSGNHVSALEDSAGRTVEYFYDGSGNLTSVTAADGAVTGYEYNPDHLMTAIVRPGGGRTETEFDSQKRVVAQEDPIGRITTFSYDWNGTTTTLPDGTAIVEQYTDSMLTTQVVAQGTPAEATTQYSYSEQNLLASVLGPMGDLTTYTYDSAGNRLSQIDALSRESTWTYGTLPSPLTSTDPEGRTTTTTYSSSGQPLTVTTPGGAERTWTYNPDGTVATFEDANGGVATYTYDSAGRVVSAVDDLDNETTFTYNAFGLVASTTSPEGGTTSTTYDAAGRTLSVEDPLDGLTEYSYDTAGNLLSETNEEDETTTYTYDAAGQLLTETDAEGGMTTLTYDLVGNVTSQTDGNGHTTDFSYDHHRNLLTTTDPLDRTTSHTYDLAGNRLSTELATGAVTTYIYDAASQLIETSDALGKSSIYSYDDAGQLTSIEDPLGRTMTTTYDLDGRVVQVDLPDASTQLYEYDDAGNVLSFTNADGLESTYSYSSTGLLLARTDPGALTTEYEYDDDGRLAVKTLPDNTETSYEYDLAGQITDVSYSSSPSDAASYAYDATGRVTSVTDATGATTLEYDNVGQLTSETDGSGDALTYTYDDAGRLLTITYPTVGTVTYSYDDADQLASVTDWASRSTSFTWTDDGGMATQTFPNGVVQTREQDLTGRTTALTAAEGSTELAEFTYTYDDAGQLSTQTTQFATSGTSFAFEYDELGQLTNTERDDGVATPTTVDIEATAGGMLTTTDDGSALTYNSAQQVVNRDPLSGPDSDYTYDGNGSRASEVVASSPAATTTYGYDGAGYLSEVTTPSSTIVYETDARGLRQSRNAGSTENFLWSTVGSTPLMVADETTYYLYGVGVAPLAEIDKSTGAVTYLHADDLGSIRLATDNTADVLGTQTFSEYGSVLASSGSLGSRFGFSGNWTDPGTGFVHLRARDYDPSTGQFLSVDPALESTKQPYAYAGNNPVQLTDHLGLDPWSDFWGDFGEVGVEIGNQFMFVLAGILDAVTFNTYSGYAQGQAPSYDCMKEKYKIYYNAGQFGVLAGSLVALGAAALPGIFTRFGAAGGAAVEGAYSSSQVLLRTSTQLQSKFKHAADFGITGNYNNANAAAFSAAINQHVNAAGTVVIQGTYRGQSVTHYLDPQTGLNVMSRGDEFISGWKLSAEQLANVLRNGSLGGG